MNGLEGALDRIGERNKTDGDVGFSSAPTVYGEGYGDGNGDGQNFDDGEGNDDGASYNSGASGEEVYGNCGCDGSGGDF